MSEKTFSKNLSIILSIVFATVLWFIVMTDQNPEISRDIDVPVKLVNVEALERNNMIMMEDPNSFIVTLKLKGSKDTVDKVNEATVSAIADMYGYKYEGVNYVSVSLSGVPEGVNITMKPVRGIKVTLEPKIRVAKPVQYKITGNPTQGLAAMTPILTPTDVFVTGAKSQVERVSVVRVDIDIAGVSADVVKKLPVRILDAEGSDIPNLVTDPANIDVTVPISRTKRVMVKLDVQGLPADDYVVSGKTVFPMEILLTGRQSDLDQISSVRTELIDITGLENGVDKDVSLVLPEGVELANRDELIRTHIVIEKITTRQIAINTVEYRNNPGFNVEGGSRSVYLTVKGAQSMVDDAQEHVKLFVDLKNAVEGNASYNIMTEKPDELEIIEITPNQINLTLQK